MAKKHRVTTYERWMAREGLPVIHGHGTTDVRALELAYWPRLGGLGAFLQLIGLEGLTGLYVGEIPPGGSLEPEKHLYDEIIYVLDGQGTTEVWNGSKERPSRERTVFEWQAGALFSPPLNTWHRLNNGGGSKPVRFLGATSAPLVLDLYHSPEFVFGCEYQFLDRFSGKPDYFDVGDRRLVDQGATTGVVWETNYIPDVRTAPLDAQEKKGPGINLTWYELSDNTLVGHMAEWPVGRYHKGHYHGGGAILLIVRSQGYTLMWPQEAGVRPYESGCADQVVRIDWREGSVLSPPTGWFHQHFNTGPVPARQLAIRYGSQKYGVQFHDVQSREGVYVSVNEGGSLIEYEDEDPEIRRIFAEECARNGVEVQMPPTLAAHTV